MKILFLNAAYFTGIQRGFWQHLTHPWRHLIGHPISLRKTHELITSVAPDVVALAEVDSGSSRAQGKNQVEALKTQNGFVSALYDSKYDKKSPAQFMPILRHSCNAVLLKEANLKHHFHYLSRGMKRLVIEIELAQGVRLFVVHLALITSVRKTQLTEVAELVRRHEGSAIVVGDFNMFGGVNEATFFEHASGLTSVNAEHRKTFPRWKPNKELDYFFISPDLSVQNFEVLASDISDHLPIVLTLA